MDRAIAHYFRRTRTHQQATWDKANNSGGGAWPGEHAAAALQSARAHKHFMERMEKYCAPKKRRAKKR
jgi:hypothetical protein